MGADHNNHWQVLAPGHNMHAGFSREAEMARRKVGAEELEKMPAAEVRAVAGQRGYRVQMNSGRHRLIVQFLKEQDKDLDLEQVESTTPVPRVEEAPEIDKARSDDDLLAQFEAEAKDRGYDAEPAASIAQGRLLDLRSGGDGYTVRAAPLIVPTQLETQTSQVEESLRPKPAAKHASAAKPKPARVMPTAKVPEEQ